MSKVQVNVKPLSVNEAWQGRRFKTPKYKRYERDVFYQLPKNFSVPDGDIAMAMQFGFSNKASDIDNGVKLVIDILQKKYGFNDKRITRLAVEKLIVNKGQEYFTFQMVAA